MDDELGEGLQSSNRTGASAIHEGNRTLSRERMEIGSWKRFVRPEGGIVSIFTRLHMLGVVSDEAHKVTMKIVATMGAIYGFLMIMTAAQGLIAHAKDILTAIAAAETIAYAIAQQWHAIAMAALGMVMVGVGLKFGEGDWKFPSVNTNDHHGVRQSLNQAINEYRRGQMQKGEQYSHMGQSEKAIEAYKNAGMTDVAATKRYKDERYMWRLGGERLDEKYQAR